MPTKNFSFLVAFVRLLLRKYGRELGLPVVTLIVGCTLALGVYTNTSVTAILDRFIEDYESKGVRTFDDVIRDFTTPDYILTRSPS